MKSLEIISLRTAGFYEKEARKYLNKFCRIAKKHDMCVAHVYTHSAIPGDLALIITSETEKENGMKTCLGNYMVDVLRQFGLVDYNCWLQS